MKKTKQKKPFDWTRTIVLITLISLLAVYGGPRLMENSQRRQLEKEFAYSFCAMQVIEFAGDSTPRAKYWYQEAKRIEPTIREKKKIYGIQKKMEKAFWDETN